MRIINILFIAIVKQSIAQITINLPKWNDTQNSYIFYEYETPTLAPIRYSLLSIVDPIIEPSKYSLISNMISTIRVMVGPSNVTMNPTMSPTMSPTMATMNPNMVPTLIPTLAMSPTMNPTIDMENPTTIMSPPTRWTTGPSRNPVLSSNNKPNKKWKRSRSPTTTTYPTRSPTTTYPTRSPTIVESSPNDSPTKNPTFVPTRHHTDMPTM